MTVYRWDCLVLILFLWSVPAFAKEACNSRELDKGAKAVLSGDIAAAVNSFMPMAKRGCAEAMHNMGVLTHMMSEHRPKSGGRDLRLDSYMWLRLAADHHPPGLQRENSLQNLASVVSGLSMTSKQIAEGERLAKEWRAGQDLPKQKPAK